MSGKRCHARGTPNSIVLDLLPSAFLAGPETGTFPYACPADGTGIPVPLHRKASEPVSHRTPAASTPR